MADLNAKVITPDAVSLTTHHLHLCFRETDTVLSSATGFVYARNGTSYLVTNWHNVSGRDPNSGEYLSPETAAIPDTISTLFRCKERVAHCIREHISLYNDSQMSQPVWHEHPKHGRAVDVVVIPLADELRTSYELFPINAIAFDSDFKEQVADEAFVIGFPFFDTPHLQMPIWKRASIASEPDIDVDGLPKLFIDTATRPGLSGSPVIMQRIGLHGMKGEALTGTEIIGRIRNFVGVYSGRIGENEFKAQLGIVWKARVIDEIIDSIRTETECERR